ncbi:tetratricopeptide repeat-containing sensor histidine kinase [Ichthyenterobacterium magnum]|nr:tetratricopeptide repeat protein [Ichthyenterobacterium magnum]
MKKLALLLILLLSYSNIFSQNLDSLLTVANATKNDSAKIRMYNKIGFSYIFNDTDKALEVIIKGKKLAKEKKFMFGLTELTNTHGIYMDVTGKLDSAKFYFTKALKLSREHKISIIESMCLNNLGMFNWNNGNYNEALNYFFQALKMYENINDEKSVSVPLNNIGLIYQEMNLSEKALDYHKQALEIRKKYKLEKDQVASLNNIGICYKELGQIDNAISVYKEGLKLAKTSDNLLDYYRLLDNLANSYHINGDYLKSIEIHLKALDKPDNFNADEKGNLVAYANLVSSYNHINKPEKGLFFAKKGFDIIKKYPDFEHYSADLFLHAAESNYMLGNIKTARTYIDRFVAIKDSLFSEQNAKAIADLEVQYDTEKKEKQILIQRAELAEQSLTIQKRNYQLYGLIGLALILGIIGYLFYNQQKLKNQQLQKENELKDALVKIETQNRLQEQRLRISRDLHDNIGAQLTFIISSIDNLKYGFEIKDEQLTSKLDAISNFASSTIYELRDTIWAMNKSEISFEDLQARISNFIDKANSIDDAINFSFAIDNSVNLSKEFTSVEGMNIHRVLQEAIHNSIKHAEASEIKVNVSQYKNAYHFEVSDNGKGFNPKTVKKGNGLNNMQNRIHDIGGEFAITSNETSGTKIRVKI